MASLHPSAERSLKAHAVPGAMLRAGHAQEGLLSPGLCMATSGRRETGSFVQHARQVLVGGSHESMGAATLGPPAMPTSACTACEGVQDFLKDQRAPFCAAGPACPLGPLSVCPGHRAPCRGLGAPGPGWHSITDGGYTLHRLAPGFEPPSHLLLPRFEVDVKCPG